MKKLLKTKILLCLVILGLVSCGGPSDPANGNASSVIGIDNNGNITTSNTAQTYSTIEQLRSAFNTQSLTAGLNQGTFVYHIGPYYGGVSSSGGFDVSVSGCLFGFIGDCDDNGSDINSQLNAILDRGEVLRVDELVNKDQVNVSRAIGVSNNDFTYEQAIFDRDSSDYRAMLGLDINYTSVNMYPASVVITNGQSGQSTINAVLVEYITSTFNYVSDIKRYIVSTNLPVISNPIAVVEGVNPELTGALKSVGNNLNVVRINMTNMTGVNYSGQLTPMGQQSVQIN